MLCFYPVLGMELRMTTTFPSISISTDRLVMRPFEMADIPAYIEMMNDEAVVAWMDGPNPYTQVDAERWVRRIAPAERTGGHGIALAVTEFLTQRLVGSVRLLTTDWRTRSTEVRYITAPWARGEGYATESVLAIAEWLFRDQGFERIELRTPADNTASQQVAQKLGCISEGVLRNARIARTRTENGTDGGWTDIRTDLIVWGLLPEDLEGVAEQLAEPAVTARTTTGSSAAARPGATRGPKVRTRYPHPCPAPQGNTPHRRGASGTAGEHPAPAGERPAPQGTPRTARVNAPPLRHLRRQTTMADRVTVIGWDGSPLPGAATAALSGRHARRRRRPPPRPAGSAAGRRTRPPRQRRPRRPQIAGHRGSAVVLADGDPGFFGVVRTLRAREHGLEVEVVPAVSSVATAFARAGMPWDDAQIVVAHPRTLRRAVNVCRAHHKVAVLTSPGAGPAELALLLDGIHRTFVICEELGTDRERVTVLTSDKAADHAWRDPNVVIVIAADPRPPRRARWIAGRQPAYPQGRAAGPCPPRPTGPPGPNSCRSPARASSPVCAPPSSPASAPAPATCVWDIGSGSGALAVEARPLRRGGPRRGRRPGRLRPHRGSRPRLRRPQVQVVRGSAPHVLERLPEPDVVRIGGGEPRGPGHRGPAAGTHRHPRLQPGRGRGARRGPHRQPLHRRMLAAPVRRPGHRGVDRAGEVRGVPSLRGAFGPRPLRSVTPGTRGRLADCCTAPGRSSFPSSMSGKVDCFGPHCGTAQSGGRATWRSPQ
ncbi:hypothetical protein SBADM41S_05389 [Streptomyces badius]